MRDKYNNIIQLNDRITFAVKVGRSAELVDGFVVDMQMRSPFAGADKSRMLLVNSMNRQFWVIANKVVGIPDILIPSKRLEKHDDTEEAIEVTPI